MYVVTSCGTSALGAIINGPASYWLLAPVPLALVVLLTVQINERRTQATIKTLSRV